MQNDTQHVLGLLRGELQFLEHGGYRSPVGGWMPPLAFEDSPTCLRQRHLDEPCRACPLIQFVPPSRRSEVPACRHIPLDDQGTTLSELYLRGTPVETETALRAWLTTTIHKLEQEG